MIMKYETIFDYENLMTDDCDILYKTQKICTILRNGRIEEVYKEKEDE